MFWQKISQGIKEIGENMINNPKDWYQGDYFFTNTKFNDISIWTCNGVFGCKLLGHEGLNIAEKKYLMDCVAQSKANKLIKK